MADSSDVPGPPPRAKGLRRRASRGLLWTAGSAVAGNGIRLVTLAALSRLLTKSDLGLIAAALTVVALATVLRDLGVGMALVQRSDLSDEHVETASSVSMALGLVLGGALYASAPLVEDAYGYAGLGSLVTMLSLMVAIRGLATVPLFLCQRALRFREIGIIDLVGYAAGSATSVGLALTGHGVTSMVWGYLVETGLSTLLLVVVQRPPRLRFHGRAFRELMAFGGPQTVAVVANFAATQGDYFVVGTRLPAADLGVYNRAYELVRFPSQVFQTVVGAVLFPTLSRLQGDPERLGHAFRRVLFATAVILLPATAGLIVLAPEVLRAVLGEGWDAGVLPFQLIAATMMFRTSYKIGAIVARANGDVHGVAVTQIGYALLVVGGGLFTVRWGIAGVAVSTAAAQVFTFLAHSALGIRHSALSWRSFLAVHLDALLAAAVVLAAAWPVATLLRDLGSHFAVTIAGTGVAGVAALAALFAIRVRAGAADWAWSWTLARDLGRQGAKAIV
jgi:O-antigen/teichoic acid export membrane protein